MDTSQNPYRQEPASKPQQKPIEPTSPVYSPTARMRELFHQRIGRLGFLFGLACVFPLLIGLFTYFLPLLFITVVYLEALFKIHTDPNGFFTSSTIDASDHLFVTAILLLILILLAATISLFMRRLHDIGQPGTWLILFIFPPVGFLVILYLLTAPGDKGSNQYGEPIDSFKFFRVTGLK